MAWFMARGMGPYEEHVGPRKQVLFSDLRGTLVEIGSGTGSNLKYLPTDVHLIGVDPNPFMHRRFKKEARSLGRQATLVMGSALALPFPDESVDAVVSTLVLCSLRGLDDGLQEVIRVLKPGGRFLFIEHVAAPEGSWLARVQRWIRPAWRWAGDGCEPDRNTEEFLHRAGFQTVEIDRFRMPVPIVSPHISGYATKSG